MNLRKTISEILKRLGISCDLLGYQYMREAIMMMVDNNVLMHKGITKLVYPTIAKSFGAVSTGAVERAIRHAISRVYVYGDRELINEIFHNAAFSKNERLTNSQFLTGIADYVSLNFDAEMIK